MSANPERDDKPGADWRRELEAADLVLVGPAPPLRGGIAQHTARLAEAARTAGLRVAAISYRRLYPASLFPGRSQRIAAPAPAWSRELVDVLSPASWLEAARLLEASRATVALQWWHPIIAPALAVAVRRVPRERLAAVCHNFTPHEPVPGAVAAARLVLSRCGRVACHSESEAGKARAALAGRGAGVVVAGLPCLLAESVLAAGRPLPELARLPAGVRLAAAVGHARPYKDLACLLDAWRRASLPSGARLVVAGESYLAGGARREVEAAAGRDASIILVDRYLDDEELVYLLRSAEVVLTIHLRASQSGVVPLARAVGTPCIASDAGGLPEQVAGDDEIVPAGNAEVLRAALERRFAMPPPGRRVAGDPARRARDWQLVLEGVLGGGVDGR